MHFRSFFFLKYHGLRNYKMVFFRRALISLCLTLMIYEPPLKHDQNHPRNSAGFPQQSSRYHRHWAYGSEVVLFIIY